MKNDKSTCSLCGALLPSDRLTEQAIVCTAYASGNLERFAALSKGVVDEERNRRLRAMTRGKKWKRAVPKTLEPLSSPEPIPEVDPKQEAFEESFSQAGRPGSSRR